MEPTTPHSVHRAPTWTQAGSSAPPSAGNPLAFFDLIMSNAQKMSARGGERNDMMTGMAPPETPNRQPVSSNDNSSHWEDDRPHETRRRNESSGGSSTTAEPEHVAEHEGSAAVTEFSERLATEDEEQSTPDEEAMATAAAAGQNKPLLAAPDPRQSAEDAASSESEAEQADARLAKSNAADRAVEKPAELDTHVPLDTSADVVDEKVEQAADHQAVAGLGSEMDAAARKGRTQEKDEKPTESKAVDPTPLDGDLDASAEVKAEPESSRQVSSDGEGKQEVSLIEAESSSEDAQRRESKQEPDRSASAERPKPNTSKPTIAEVAQETGTATEPGLDAAAQKSTAASVATAAAATAATSTNGTADRAASSNDAGTNGITSLLQRGLQRGTLQKSTEAKPAAGLDTKQQMRLVNRVARAVETTPPGQAIRIRLNPSELGALKVEIKIESGNLTARIEAENPATRQVLLENLPQLRERLAESNIQVQQFEVDLMGQENSSDRETSNLSDEASRRDEGGSSRGRNSDNRSEDEAHQDAPSPVRVNKEAERESRNLNVTA